MRLFGSINERRLGDRDGCYYFLESNPAGGSSSVWRPAGFQLWVPILMTPLIDPAELWPFDEIELAHLL
jgi:hypothetical protein